MNRMITFALIIVMPLFSFAKNPKFPANPDQRFTLSLQYRFDISGYGESNIKDSYGNSSMQEADPRTGNLSLSMIMPVSNCVLNGFFRISCITGINPLAVILLSLSGIFEYPGSAGGSRVAQGFGYYVGRYARISLHGLLQGQFLNLSGHHYHHHLKGN